MQNGQRCEKPFLHIVQKES